MSTHKFLTISPTNRSNRSCGSKNVAFYLRSLLYYRLLSQGETLYLHYKDPLHKILLCCLSQHRKISCPLLWHILSFILTFLWYPLVWNSVFANCFCLWNISCLNLCDGLFNVNGRVILSPIFHGRRGHDIEKGLTQRAHTMGHGSYFLAVSVP